MSNGGREKRAVEDRAELPAIWLSEDFFEGLEEEPLRETDLSAGGGAVARDGCDDDLLGRGEKRRVGERLEFGGVLGSAEVGFNAADFVEVGHASAGVSKNQRFNHGGHGEHGGETKNPPWCASWRGVAGVVEG